MINYTTPEEVLTYLPKEIRASESREDLISYIIRGYRRLKLPQDKDIRTRLIDATDNVNYRIEDDIRSITSVHAVYNDSTALGHEYYDSDCTDCLTLVPVYYDGIQSGLCNDKKICNGCAGTYSVRNGIVTFPSKGEYVIYYNNLFSEGDEMLILDDETLKEYLASYATWKVSYDRARSSDVQTNLLTLDQSIMNTLYTQARGQAIMQMIKKSNYLLDDKPINLNYDEFNSRYLTP